MKLTELPEVNEFTPAQELINRVMIIMQVLQLSPDNRPLRSIYNAAVEAFNTAD